MDCFCRGCLVQFDELTDLFQYTEKNRRLFVYSTGLQVKRNDSFTFQLCKECYNAMKIACSFKKACKNSDKRLKSYFACKEAGDTVDFCTFLKNNDDNFKFRLPMVNGNSTPANQKRDDDNESTCTSIQNFMTDILQAEEIPDNEARIIREVIEEEADVLDDSLDSHWLQDDVSVDTDFRLDFSFSPFSTPRSENNEQYISSKKKEEHISLDKENNFGPVENAPEVEFQISKPIVDSGVKRDKCTIDSNLEYALRNKSAEKVYLDELLATPPVLADISAPPTPLISNILFGKKIDDDDHDDKNDSLFGEKIHDDCNDNNDTLFEVKIHDDHDDKNETLFGTQILAKHNGNNDNLFEKKTHDDLDDEHDTLFRNETDVNHHDNKDDIDVIDQFLKDDDKDEKENYDILNDDLEEISIINIDQQGLLDFNQVRNTPSECIETQYCVKNFYCKMCNRHFINLKALKIHYTKQHKSKIVHLPIRKAPTKLMCDYCGKDFASLRTIKKHILNHMKPSSYECKHCTLKFSSEKGLKFHKLTHTANKINDVIEPNAIKKYICNICGKAYSTSSNYNVHLRRHESHYTSSCKECGKGFFRSCDLLTHMRRHTGEKPYGCIHCPRRFSRTDVLNRHIKCHTDERLYTCNFCDKKFAKANEVKMHQVKSKKCLKLQLLIDKR